MAPIAGVSGNNDSHNKHSNSSSKSSSRSGSSAPGGGDSSAAPNGVNGATEADGDNNRLWAKLLTEVQSKSTRKLPKGKRIVIMGENETGKTSLVAKVKGDDDPKKGQGLEYHAINVRDEDRDESVQMGVFIVDGDLHHAGLLRFALSEETFPHTLICLTVSMARPWTIMSSLDRWSQLLRRHIDRLKISPQDMKDFESQLQRHFQEYIEPDEAALQSGNLPKRSGLLSPAGGPGGEEDESVLLPLGETTLTDNLGLPIMVVVTKTDAIANLEKEFDYREEHFDFIQQHIRHFCLHFGAALVYTSVKEDKNCDLFLKYAEHRLYGFPFLNQASVVERDAVFIPTGWDSETKISILYPNMTTVKPEDSFDEVIVRPVPVRKPIPTDPEVIVEDEQTFLLRQQQLLTKALPSSPGVRVDGARVSSASGVPKSLDRRSLGSPQVSVAGSGSPASMKKLDASSTPSASAAAVAGATSQEGVLANFFNSLLSKKTGSPGGGGPGGAGGMPGSPVGSGGGLSATASPVARPMTPGTDKASVRNDAAAELERMTRGSSPQVKPLRTTTPTAES